MSPKLLEMAQRAVRLAMRSGADEAAAVVSRSRGVSIEWRDGKLERAQEATQRSLAAEVYVDGRFGASSTNDLRPEALASFLADAVTSTRLLEPDPHRGLPEAKQYGGRIELDLDLDDPAQPLLTPEQRLDEANKLEVLIREQPEKAPIVSTATGTSDRRAESARVHSNGFEGCRAGTSFARWCEVTLKDADGRRPTGEGFCSRRHLDELIENHEIARQAHTRAIAQLGAGKLPTGRYTIVVENSAMGRLVGALLGPLSGAALQQHRSVWEGRLNTTIAHSRLTLISDPHRPRGMGSALWDGDGFPSHRRPIVDKGQLRTYFIDQYYGRKLRVDPTTGMLFNLDWQYGDRSRPELIADVNNGLYINRFLGGNSNETTGDISLGCAGQVIRNGELAEAVQEVNLADNFAEMWKRLAAVGADPDLDRASSCPTCVFEGVQLSGA